jgi:hypothetical protein
MGSEIEELKQVVAQLQKQVGRLSGSTFSDVVISSTANDNEDQEDVRKLQYAYGYYLDKCLYKEASCFYTC